MASLRARALWVAAMCCAIAVRRAARNSPPEVSVTNSSVITRRADFLAANRGLRVARPGFILLAHPNGGRGTRFGITITKKVGNAVVRNRMKRRFRELLRAALPGAGLPDHDHVLIGRDGGIERDFEQLRCELAIALERAASGKGDPPRRSGGRGRPRKGNRQKATHPQPSNRQA